MRRKIFDSDCRRARVFERLVVANHFSLAALGVTRSRRARHRRPQASDSDGAGLCSHERAYGYASFHEYGRRQRGGAP